jgi:hypothetical protein
MGIDTVAEMLVAGGVGAGVGAVGVGVGLVGDDDPLPHETRMIAERVMSPSWNVFTIVTSLHGTATLQPLHDRDV